MRHRLVLLLLVAAVVFGFAGPAAADHDSTTSVPVLDSPSIIPRPNTGVEPTDSGDRGGVLQVTVFVALLAGIGGIGALVVRQSRTARAGRASV